jgi:serine phosphatase RsbU (regulator of sigma subunit)
MEKHLIEHELEIGRQIQSGFFPEKLPEIPGWEISAFFRPTRQVSGDFYDSFPLASNRLTGIVIADVCDKGVGAALFMALTRSLIRAFASQTILLEEQTETALASTIGQALKRTILLTNNYIAETHGQANMFATLFIGILEPDTGMLHYINCGHEPPIILSTDNQIASLKPTGPALGLFPDVEFGAEKILLTFGDLLFAFTDGVTDAQSETGELYSKEKLQACLAQNLGSAEGLIQQVLQNVEMHIASAKQFDDITMIAVQRSYP